MSSSPVLGNISYVLIINLSMSPLIYKPEGLQLSLKLWEETMNEFSFAGAREIIDSLSK